MISNPCVIVVCDTHGCIESTKIMLEYDERTASWGIDGMFDTLDSIGWHVLQDRELCPNCKELELSKIVSNIKKKV